MHVLLLGSAAGGGFPQWNCWCPCCRVARSDPSAARPRTQSSAAISVDGDRWFLLNASPDVREQLRWLRTEEPPSTVRHIPLEGVLVTDAELDHTLGIVLLREARHLPVYATLAVQSILDRDSRVLPMTRAFGEVPVTELPLNTPVHLCYRDGSASGLAVEAFPVPAGPLRFATREEEGHTVGFMLREEASGLEHSPERAIVTRTGVIVGFDGLHLTLSRSVSEKEEHAPSRPASPAKRQ